MNNQTLLRPRWATFLVIDHKNLISLIPEVLLYDRLVFPVPTDEADRARWKDPRNNWDPDLLAQRIKELGDLAIPTPWTLELREEWSVRWERLKQLGKDTRGIAMNLTPHILSMKAWQDRVPPPIMIAAYQNAATARADFNVIEDRDVPRSDRAELHREVGVLFERNLTMPRAQDSQRAFEKAIKLAHNSDFLHARRNLFEWEDQIVTAGWPIEAAMKELKWRVEAHDDFVKSTFEQTGKQRIFRVVQFVGGAIGGPLAPAAIEGIMKVVEATFPSLIETGSPRNPMDDPGAALNMALSAMYHN